MRFFLRLLLALVLGVLGGYLGRKVIDGKKPAKAPQAAIPAAQKKPKEAGEGLATPQPGKGLTTDEKKPDPPFPTGWVMKGSRWIVTMSDGTIRFQHTALPKQSDGISQITPSSVVLNGEKLFFKPNPKQKPVSGDRTPQKNGEDQEETPAVQGETQEVKPEISGWVRGADGVLRSPQASLGVGK
jgi:hypothetical protein